MPGTGPDTPRPVPAQQTPGRGPTAGGVGIRDAARAATATMRRTPVTVGAVLILWTLGAGTGSLLDGPAPGLLAAVGAGVGPLRSGHWWFPLTAPWWCSGLVAYLASTAVMVGLLGLAERRLGGVRAAALALLVQAAGCVVGVTAVALLATARGRWADLLAASVAVGPSPAVVGTGLAVSAVLPALWRRRLRVVLLVGLAMMALYSGLLADVLRLVTGLLGLGVGVLWLGRHHRPRAPSRPEARVLVALVVAASAVGPLIAAIVQTRVGPLSVLRYVFASPPPDTATVDQICAAGAVNAEQCADLRARLRLSGVGPGLLSVLPVLLLLVVAEGLRRARRAAWLAAIGLNVALAGLGVTLAVITAATPADQRVVLGAGSHLHSWLALTLPALQPLLVAGMLAATGPLFRVRAPTGTYRRWGVRIAVAALAVSAVYVVGSVLVVDQYDRPPGPGALLLDLPTRFLPPGYLGEVESAFLPVGPVATALFEWTGVVFWAVVLLAALDTFARTAPPPVDSDLARVRGLLGGTGGSTLAHLATWPGQSYWFARPHGRAETGPPEPGDRAVDASVVPRPGGSDGPDAAAADLAAVAFRVIGGVAVTTGEPVGDPVHRERAVHGFAAHCRQQGWTPCLYTVGTEVADIARAMGWNTVQVAEETVLELPELTFTGKKWQDVRTALNKAGKAGIIAEWTTYRDAPLAVTDQVRTISEEWVADKGMPEMGFTLGGLDELDDPEVGLLLAVDADRTVHGITSWLPVRRDGQLVGWTLDFMRRRTGGFRGVMEFLIASAVLRGKDQGIEFLSLSGAPLARLDPEAPVAGLERVLEVAGRALEPVYGFRSLLAFKAKFQPEYRPLYLAYPDPAALPAIGNAIGRAYLPDLTFRQVTRLAHRAFRMSTRHRSSRALHPGDHLLGE